MSFIRQKPRKYRGYSVYDYSLKQQNNVVKK